VQFCTEEAIIVNTSLTSHTEFKKESNIEDDIDSELTAAMPLPSVSTGINGRQETGGRNLSK
jgi:hypothetical protein